LKVLHLKNHILKNNYKSEISEPNRQMLKTKDRIKNHLTDTENASHRNRYFRNGIIMVVALFSMSITHTGKNSYSAKTDEKGIDQLVILPKKFSAMVIDDNNIKWFLTELGIVSFDGKKWKLHNENSKVATENLRGFALEANPDRPAIWIASPNGATVASLPVDAGAGVTTYLPENSSLTSKNVFQVAVGKSLMRWFGTDRGVSGLRNDKWLAPDYNVLYPERMFVDFPIISMAVSLDGDSLYVGTAGAGVTRVFRNDVDGISGASNYAKWGPIILPSDYVYSIFIASDGTQWFGTDQGVAKHEGGSTLDNWTVYTTEEGLIDNFVQAITADKDEKLWFGTRGGISVFDGSAWTAFKKDNGLVSNNILCLGLDKDGVIWIGTDNGVNCFKNGEFISYK